MQCCCIIDGPGEAVNPGCLVGQRFRKYVPRALWDKGLRLEYGSGRLSKGGLDQPARGGFQAASWSIILAFVSCPKRLQN